MRSWIKLKKLIEIATRKTKQIKTEKNEDENKNGLNLSSQFICEFMSMRLKKFIVNHVREFIHFGIELKSICLNILFHFSVAIDERSSFWDCVSAFHNVYLEYAQDKNVKDSLVVFFSIDLKWCKVFGLKVKAQELTATIRPTQYGQQ